LTWVNRLPDIFVSASPASARASAQASGRLRPGCLLPVSWTPRIQAATLDGRKPKDLSVAQLLRDRVPMDWREQARLFAVK